MNTQSQHGGNVQRYLKSKKPFFDFSANINPTPAPFINKIIKNNLHSLKHYPEATAQTLKKTICQKLAISEKNIAIGNGSIELIYLIPRAVKSNNALIIPPTFSEYEQALRSHGTDISFFKLNEKNHFHLPIPKLIQTTKKNIDLIFLCNPNNPTGKLIAKEELHPLISHCKRKKITLVIDEAFIDFSLQEEKTSFIREAATNKYLIVSRSVTKFFEIPGLRVGYICSHRDTIKKITKLQYPWNVNAIAQIVGDNVIKNQLFIKKSKQFIDKEKEYLAKKLAKLPTVSVFSPSVNFILCKLTSGNVDILQKKLAKKNILIRNCASFRGLNNTFFRVAVKSRKENNLLFNELKKLFKN